MPSPCAHRQACGLFQLKPEVALAILWMKVPWKWISALVEIARCTSSGGSLS